MPVKSVYKQLVDIVDDYLGPVSERFLERIIRHHLNKDPKKITPKDIPDIAGWIKVAMGLLTEDRDMINDCERRILSVAGS